MSQDKRPGSHVQQKEFTWRQKAVRAEELAEKRELERAERASVREAARAERVAARQAERAERTSAQKAIQAEKLAAREAARAERTGLQKAVQKEKTGLQKAVQKEKTGLQKAVQKEKTGVQKAVQKEGTLFQPAVQLEKGRPPLTEKEKRRRRVFIIAAVAAALLLALIAIVLSPSRGSERKGYMNRASALYAAGDYDAALSNLRKAADIETDDACLLLMADCYEAQGNIDKTLELLRRMESADESVMARIDELEQRKRLEAEAGMLTVAGQRVAPDCASLTLDGQGLSDGVLGEIAQLYALNSLSLMDNAITDISPLAELGGLDTLNLSGNHIGSVAPLAGLQNLRTLYLDGNPITDFSPLTRLSSLTTLSITGIEIDTRQRDELAAALPGCAIHSDTPRAATTDITLGGVTFKSTVTELKLEDLDIHDISALAECGALKWLDLSGNNIGDLTPLMNLPQLESVDISGNLVTDLRPLMGLTSLRSVNAAGNRIMDTAAVGAMSALSSLDLSDNPISDFSGLRRLRNLVSLRLVNTGITDYDLIHLEQMSLLKNLWLDENLGLSNEAMGQLQSALPGCAITYTELVYTVEIGGIEVSSDSSLLELPNAALVDLSALDQMSCLERVNLSGNEIRNIYVLQYSPSRDTIRSLDLSHNGLADISALAALTAVESLDLSYNSISSVLPLQRLATLRTLDLTGNPLSEAQLEELRLNLPNCEIVFE